MAGERLESAEVGWHGIEGDRRWAFVRDGLERSNFPWLTIRERPEMHRFVPRFAEPGRPEASPTLVRTPGGDELDVTDPALVAALGGDARVIKQNRGTFDIAPLSLISTASVGALEVQRFRPNLLIDATGDDPFPEDAWVGATLAIGTLRMRVDQRDKRCVMVNVDPATGERDPAILRRIAQERESCLGVYGTTVTPSVVRAGDPVVVEA